MAGLILIARFFSSFSSVSSPRFSLINKLTFSDGDGALNVMMDACMRRSVHDRQTDGWTEGLISIRRF